MKPKLDEEICLFVRDEQSGRFLFNPMALQVLGINPTEARQGRYPIKEQSAVAEAAEDINARRRMNDRPQSRKVHCEAFEISERAVSQGTLVSGAQDHARRLACLEGFLPARCA